MKHFIKILDEVEKEILKVKSLNYYQIQEIKERIRFIDKKHKERIEGDSDVEKTIRI